MSMKQVICQFNAGTESTKFAGVSTILQGSESYPFLRPPVPQKWQEVIPREGVIKTS